ncbi:hypothetical protein I5Q34_05985 [Streptomyces sp. AV19]|uniref:hypothetical protein n=1 Tax=Streptomyces sp. AV19 TaxID=2793068 RepID=UPI0018FE9666|nr:hypothetical protein [Streptomyces sp. AV19]MBH1933847.1 hypothetical protein [Streptomyces sp. AV19]MDG4533199.1 hypothetical protein [Streptomyces sp. AV19]
MRWPAPQVPPGAPPSATGTLASALAQAGRLPEPLGGQLADAARASFVHSVHVHALPVIPLLLVLALAALLPWRRGAGRHDLGGNRRPPHALCTMRASTPAATAEPKDPP